MNTWHHPVTNWQPIETLPEAVAVDLWIKSVNNPNYGRRAVDACRIDDKWFGKDFPNEEYGEYASHWMRIALPPLD